MDIIIKKDKILKLKLFLEKNVLEKNKFKNFDLDHRIKNKNQAKVRKEDNSEYIKGFKTFEKNNFQNEDEAFNNKKKDEIKFTIDCINSNKNNQKNDSLINNSKNIE